jgi:tRNA wybutosine-synthesizing protein 3
METDFEALAAEPIAAASEPLPKKETRSRGGRDGGASSKKTASAVPTAAMLQQRLDKTFAEDKKRILDGLETARGCDNSPKGFVDPVCLPLMYLLNAHADYVTTSSCSGRIALFHSLASEAGSEGGVKRGNLKARGWVFVSHDLLTVEQQEEIVLSMHNPPTSFKDEEWGSVAASSGAMAQPTGADEGYQAHVGESTSFRPPGFGELSLKCEPFVMHVQCRTMESAKTLLSAAVSDAGFRNSGVVPPGARIMVAIRHAGLSLDVPLILGDGVGICCDNGESGSTVSRRYLMELLKLSNQKLTENFRRIRILEDAVAKRIAS